MGGPPGLGGSAVGGPPMGPGAGPSLGSSAASLLGGAASSPSAPPGSRPSPSPTMMTVALPQGTSFQRGSVIQGQVTGQDPKGGYSLQLGDRTLTAQSNSSLSVGQPMQLLVHSQSDGQVTLQMVNTPFSQMNSDSLASNLSSMRLPATPANMQLAQSMAELGVPLTKDNVTKLLSQTAMPDGGATGPSASNPPPMQARVAAVVFMEQNNIPVTPQNMLTMSQFMASNPQVGQQMLAMSGELRKLSKGVDGKPIVMTSELHELTEEGEVQMGLDPKAKMDQNKEQLPKQLFNMAKQTGIETHLTPFGGGEDPWELLAELKKFRAENEGLANEKDMAPFLKLLGEVEKNVDAQKLINLARPEQLYGFYYLQFPLRGTESIEVWIRYRKEDDGSKKVDSDDCVLEFLVTTEHLGELFFVVDIQGLALDIQIGVESDPVVDFVSGYLEALQERLEQNEWGPVTARCHLRNPGSRRELVERYDFAEMESCDVQVW